ncbi:MAG: TIGR01777 family protein [Bacteroidetes bacterium]|nr:TIGR01777 family protein [Bacteroidota bacterium]
MADVIINLAGEGIADKRWTARRKRKIINSRIFSTNLLVESLKVIPNKVQLIINASAIGIYGDTGEMIMNESSPLADDFLGQTCKRWELAAHEFEKQKIRTVIFRIGLVLAAEGGFLPQIKQPLRFGFAPYIGNGQQYQSWIHINDLCRMMMMAIENDSWNGTYNAVAPGPLSNKNFMKLLTHILGGRFLLVKIPKFLIRILFGEMSKLVTGGTRVSSKKIEAAGFSFSYPQANHALRDLLGK